MKEQEFESMDFLSNAQKTETLPCDLNITGCLPNNFLNISEEIDTNLAPYNAPSAITTSIEITSTLLSDLGVPGASTIGLLLGKLVNLLWPGGENDKSVWTSLLNESEELVNQKIEDITVITNAETALRGMHRVLQSYRSALNSWINPKGERISPEAMRTTYISALTTLNNSMASFSVPKHELPLLTLYSQAANIYLYVAKDITIFGKEWGFTYRNPEREGDIEFYYNEFLKYTAEHSEYCIDWYNQGLNQLPQLNSRDWVKYNKYRREMTIMVLDTVSLFSSYDGFLYPQKTKTELTRMIFTDPIVYEDKPNYTWHQLAPSFSDIEDSAVPKPDYFRVLRNLLIHTKSYGSGVSATNYWSSHDLTYSLTNTPIYHQVSFGNKITNGDDKYNNFSLSGRDVYKIISIARQNGPSYTDFIVNQFEMETLNTLNQKNMLSYNHPSEWSNCQTFDSTTELPVTTNPPTTYGDDKQYSHRLGFISEVQHSSSRPNLIPIYGWTHTSVNLDNRIYSDRITQIPAIKSSPDIGGNFQNVAKGPGFNGGYVTTARSVNALVDVLKLQVTLDQNSLAQKYRVRLRYASNKRVPATLFTNTSGDYKFELQPSEVAPNPPYTKYQSFRYIDIPGLVSFTSTTDVVTVYLDMRYAPVGSYVEVDRIEFIPSNETAELEKDLEKMKQAVNALFAEGRNVLKLDVTDRQIDMLSNLINCLPEDVDPNAKRNLLNDVRYAKRLSQSRNLFVDSDFKLFNTGNGWSGSQSISISEGNILFKGPYLRLLGSNDDGSIPTYLYQRIDESKLKAYTRYKVRGFIGESKDLELYIVRYDGNTHTVMNVLPPRMSPSIVLDSCGIPDRCKTQIEFDVSDTLSTEGSSSDPHAFSYHIDIGDVDLNENLGIWVIFKISTPDGYATLGNIECVEDVPLVGGALAQIKKKEQKFKEKIIEIRADTQRIYTEAKQAINNLFTDPPQDTKLKLATSLAKILEADEIAQRIPEIYNQWLYNIQGMNYSLFQELNTRIYQALELYTLRNLVQNPRFLDELSNWNVTSNVSVQQISGIPVLVLSNWDAQVKQRIVLKEDRGYILRVTAKKEGVGAGNVIVSDCVGNAETLIFTSCNDKSTNISSNYDTQSIEFFPDADQVYIEITESEGTFYIQNIELFLMKE